MSKRLPLPRQEAVEMLVQRTTFGPTSAALERAHNLGFETYLDEQLAYDSIDDSGLEGALAAVFPSLGMSASELHTADWYQAYRELESATVLRAVFSPRQLYERIAMFWTDHFNIDIYEDYGMWLKPIDHRDVIRAHAFGTFPDLLRASAHSPAMLSYLTNDSNSKDDPNENYSRELMELHSLGADGPYTQDDVREVARCFSGWSFLVDYGDPSSIANGRFFFDDFAHDFGAKTVLGHFIAAGGGQSDGETVLNILADHPATARFIAFKLARNLLGYRPAAYVVDSASEIYRQTGGSIPAMVRSILSTLRSAAHRPQLKLKRPLHYMVSALRALEAEVDFDTELPYLLFDAGQELFAWPPPNGYPDSEGYWAGNLLPRWNFATWLGEDKIYGIAAPTPWLDPAVSAAGLVQRLDERLMFGHMSDATRAALLSFLQAGEIDMYRLQEALGLALTSPDFQVY